jgi:hypothetical protein
MKGLYYNIFRLQKVCKEYQKSVFLKKRKISMGNIHKVIELFNFFDIMSWRVTSIKTRIET